MTIKTVVLLLSLNNKCVCFFFNNYCGISDVGNRCRLIHASQTGGCDDGFPDPNFPVDDDDFTRRGLTVAV